MPVKVMLALLGVALLALGVMFKRQQGQIATLTSQLADRTAVNKLELQQKCADRARTAFKDLTVTARDSYENHYNASLNKCFINVEQISVVPRGDVTIMVGLYDAFENKKYASLIVMSDKKEPHLCRVMQVNGEEQVCNSDAEYKELIKTYMEGN